MYTCQVHDKILVAWEERMSKCPLCIARESEVELLKRIDNYKQPSEQLGQEGQKLKKHMEQEYLEKYLESKSLPNGIIAFPSVGYSLLLYKKPNYILRFDFGHEKPTYKQLDERIEKFNKIIEKEIDKNYDNYLNEGERKL